MAKKTKGVTYQRQQAWYDKHVNSLACGDYEPFWRVEDIKSSGIKVKVRHFSDPNRVIHLLSMNEMFMYLLTAWDTDIIEVHEQFAIPLEVSTAIAVELDVKHPTYFGSSLPTIQTIDFVCTRRDKSKIAYIVKQQSMLEDFRTQQKLAIQEGYCRLSGFDYQEVGSDELKNHRCENLERLYRHSKLNPMLKSVFEVWYPNFLGSLSDDRHERVANILECSAKLTGVPYQRAAHFLYHAIWSGLLTFDWYLPLVLEAAASDLELYPNDAHI